MTKDEAMQMALDVMEWLQRREPLLATNRVTTSVEALRAALAQPEPEPVAWLFQHKETGLTECIDTQQVEWGFEKNNPRWQKIEPLYTAPPQRKPLTDEQIGRAFYGCTIFVRKVEAAHGIGKVK